VSAPRPIDGPLDYDVTVVGGGIHGVGVAQAAAARGLRVLLLESRTLAAGTSSKSSKLIHGGLRYLESFELGLVRESLTERATLLRLAPDLVKLIPFFIPIYRETSRRPWQVRAGLSLYALLANLRRSGRFGTVPQAEWADLDGLRTEGLQHVFRYHDAQTDDAALTRAVMASARELGAELACPAEFDGAEAVAGGYRVSYRAGDQAREHTSAALVNAAGPWIELVREKVSPAPPGRAVDLVQGTHIELPGVVTHGIYYTEAPSDRRAVFTVPWKGHTMVGTTEQFHRGDPGTCAPTDEEVQYLRETYLSYFPGGDSTVLDTWAGLRVLPKADGSAFKRTRETIYMVDDEHKPRYLGIYGGKLTGYRATAEHVMRRLSSSLPGKSAIARTDSLPLTRVT
jgi:glycerol-3-phosphate dehydrogenase